MGRRTGNVADHADNSIAKSYLSRIEDRVRAAEDRAYDVWNVVADAEQELGQVLDDVQDLYENDARYQDVETAADVFYADVLLPVERASDAVQDAQDWFVEKRVLDRPRTGKSNLGDDVAVQEYRGQTVEAFFDMYIARAEAVREYLDRAAEDRVTELQAVPENLDAYITGEQEFEPAYGVVELDDTPQVPQSTPSYTEDELAAGIAEARARDVTGPRMSYGDVAARVDRMVEDVLGDWVDG